MIVIILLLALVLSVYLEIRTSSVELARQWNRNLRNTFSLLIIAFFGVLPKVVLGNYETFYLVHYLILLILLILIAKIDFEEKIIPNEIVMLVLTTNVMFNFIEIQKNLDDSKVIIISALLGFLSSGIFILVNFIQKSGVGVGDIKLFAVLGISIGFVGIISICINTFVLAAIASVILLRLKKINTGERIPLAPFIFLAALFYG